MTNTVPAVKAQRAALWALVALAIIILAAALWRGAGAPSPGAPLASYGAPFKLASTKGGVMDSTSLLGKPYGIFFGFTHCPEVCPTTLSDMSIAMKELGEPARDFRLLFITVDPARDSLPVMKDYLASFDPRIEGLVPTAEQLPALAKAYHIYYREVPTSDGSYTMDHTATLFLINAKGEFVKTISFDEDRATRLAKLKQLLEANPAS